MGQWVMGLGSFKSAWQRQMKDFASLKYTCLILDNRGIGESDKPLNRYSTSDMARDTLDVVNHLTWTSQRELHVVGVSMFSVSGFVPPIQASTVLATDRSCP